MKRVFVYLVLFVFVLLVSSSGARAALVYGSDEWLQPLDAGLGITCVAHFIPDVPGVVPESLVFEKAPEWTSTWFFDHVGEGWDTAISEDGKVAYLYGPEIVNDTARKWELFSYSLFYEWDDEDLYYDENNPVWVDVVSFRHQEVLEDGAVSGIPGGPWDNYYYDTWKEQHNPGSDPYENPIPEPAIVCLLGLGAVFLRKKRS
jgi:hypothetical protein